MLKGVVALLLVLLQISQYVESQSVVTTIGFLNHVTLLANKGRPYFHKCHVRNVLNNVVTGYKMHCIQCNNQRYVHILYDNQLIDEVYVDTCDHVKVSMSITLLPQIYGESLRHTLEFKMRTDTPGVSECKKLTYETGHVPVVGNCAYVQYHHKINFNTMTWAHNPMNRYVNGWQRQANSRFGMVLEVQPDTSDIPRNWEYVLSWRHANGRNSMRCYNAGLDYMVVLYELVNNEPKVMAKATTNTCLSPQIPYSISIPVPSFAGELPTRVEYIHNNGVCKIYEYRRINAHNQLFKSDHSGDCLQKPLYSVSLYSLVPGYDNKWKVEINNMDIQQH